MDPFVTAIPLAFLYLFSQYEYSMSFFYQHEHPKKLSQLIFMGAFPMEGKFEAYFIFTWSQCAWSLLRASLLVMCQSFTLAASPQWTHYQYFLCRYLLPRAYICGCVHGVHVAANLRISVNSARDITSGLSFTLFLQQDSHTFSEAHYAVWCNNHVICILNQT